MPTMRFTIMNEINFYSIKYLANGNQLARDGIQQRGMDYAKQTGRNGLRFGQIFPSSGFPASGTHESGSDRRKARVAVQNSAIQAYPGRCA